MVSDKKIFKVFYIDIQGKYCLLCWRLTTRQPLWVILFRLPRKGRKETKEIVEMKVRDRAERGTINEREEIEEIIPLSPYLLQG